MIQTRTFWKLKKGGGVVNNYKVKEGINWDCPSKLNYDQPTYSRGLWLESLTYIFSASWSERKGPSFPSFIMEILWRALIVLLLALSSGEWLTVNSTSLWNTWFCWAGQKVRMILKKQGMYFSECWWRSSRLKIWSNSVKE